MSARRPKGSPEARRVTLAVKVSTAQLDAYRAEARRRGISVGELVRQGANLAAGYQEPEAKKAT